MHIFHKWEKWKDIEKGELFRRDTKIGRYIIQQKECLKCGKKKLRTTNSRS